MRFFPKGALPITPSLICLLTFNLLDGIITLTLLELQIIREANPILARAYGHSPLIFMATKICIVYSALFIAMITPDQKLQQWFLRLGAAIYLGIVAYQLIIILVYL